MKTAMLALLAGALLTVVAQAQDYPVTFGEIRDGKVTATRVLKNCEPSTGYAYGFEISLPPGQAHAVRIGFMTPEVPGQVCVSCRSFTDDFGAQSGRFVKKLEIGTEVGDYALKVFVDRKLTSEIDYKIVKSKSCP